MFYFDKIRDSKFLYYAAILLAGISVFSLAFHFWPFESNKTWQLLCPSNLAILIWTTILVFSFVVSKQKRVFRNHLPHVSIFAYLLINILSFAFSPDIFRSIFFSIKLIFVFIGGYSLFSFAIQDKKHLAMLYTIATVSLSISVMYCLVVRFLFAQIFFGFFSSGYKYGTYIGMLTPLCAVFLILSNEKWLKLLAIPLVIGSCISSGTIGAVSAIFSGLLSPIIFINKWSVKLFVLFCLIATILAMVLLWPSPSMSGLRRDLNICEENSINVRQRYLEWQAEVNLLADLTITGTGAGCLNEYRSKYYYRLPKLNTLKPFDQNGWLTIAAEVGILGLVCFCWIICYYLKLAYSQIRYLKKKNDYIQQKFAIAGLAGLVGASVANISSSTYYNGVLIVFVFVLVLIEKNNQFVMEE